MGVGQQGSEAVVVVPSCLLTLELDRRLQGNHPRSKEMRGFFGRAFDHPLMHQHQEGKVLYRYPHVQYRWDWEKQCPVLYGVGEGALYLLELPLVGLELSLGTECARITGVDSQLFQRSFREGRGRYRFRSPWLPFKKWMNFEDRKALEEKLSRVIVSNVLIAARALGVNINWRLQAEVTVQRELKPRHKGIVRQGFLAEVVFNAELPDHLGLGNAPSHGFGWLERMDDCLKR